MTTLVPALRTASLVAAAAAIVIYVLVLLRRPEWVRLFNGSGLLLTGLALFQAPSFLHDADGTESTNAAAAVVLLILAVIAQAAAALRNRKAWDGTERRRGGELEARL